MQTMQHTGTHDRYAKCIEVSKRIRWDIDRDVIRGRKFDVHEEVPARRPLARSSACRSSTPTRSALVSQIQGRTYANIFGLVERYIGAKMLEISREHWLGDQTALEALVRFTDEELKHQELFRRIEAMMAADMPAGYTLPAAAERRRQRRAQQVDLGGAGADLPHRALHAGALPAEHRAGRAALSELWKDVFLFHWKEESQHAILDELEWQREDAKLTPHAARRGGERSHRAGRRGGRHPADAGDRRRRLLLARVRQAPSTKHRCSSSATPCCMPIAGSTSFRACRTSASRRSSVA